MNSPSKIIYASSLFNYKELLAKPIEVNRSMVLGTAIHSYLLDNEKVPFPVIEVAPSDLKVDGGVKSAVIKKYNIETDEYLTQNDILLLKKLKEFAIKNDYVKLIESCNVEVSMQFCYNAQKDTFENVYEKKYFDDSRLYLSGRCDAYNKKIIIELKTMDYNLILNKRKLVYHIIDSGYIMQLLLYKYGLQMEDNCDLAILAISNNIECPIMQLFILEYYLKEDLKLRNRLQSIHEAFLKDNWIQYDKIEKLDLNFNIQW